MNIRHMLGKDAPTISFIDNYWTPNPLSEKRIRKLAKGYRYQGFVSGNFKFEDTIKGFMIFTERKNYFTAVRFQIHPEWCDMEESALPLLKHLQNTTAQNIHRKNKFYIRIAEGCLDLQIWLKERGLKCVKIINNIYLFEYSIVNETRDLHIQSNPNWFYGTEDEEFDL